MSKFIVLLLLSLPGVVRAQASDGTATTSSSAPTAQSQTGPTAPSEAKSHRFFSRDFFFDQRLTDVHENPIASFTGSYVYVFTDSQFGHNRSLMGWSAMPEVRLIKHVDLQADFTGLNVRSVYPGVNKFVIAAGPRYTFAPRSRFTPFVYAEGGEVRLTSQADHNSDWNPVVKGGFGLEHKFTRGIAFTLIPGEYIGQQLDTHDWEHSFTTRAGITFNLYR